MKQAISEYDSKRSLHKYNIFDRLSMNECLVYLSTGYIRKEYVSFRSFPSELMSIISEFIRNILFRFSENLLKPDNMRIVPGSNNTMIELIRGGQFGFGGSALIDLPIPIDCNESKYEWNIRINTKSGRSTRNYHYFIGVTSNQCDNYEASAHAGLKHSCGIYGVENGVTVDGFYRVDGDYKTAFNDKDIINVQYNGSNKELSFSKVNAKTNELTKIYVLSRPVLENKEITHWYPAVSIRDPGDTAEIIF